MMNEANDLYRPPQSVVKDLHADPASLRTEIDAFYVVSAPKFLVLFFGTLGMYSLYWFYKHWAQQRLVHKESILPVMRAIFAIFFVYRLFERIQAALNDRQRSYHWNPSLLAIAYIVLALLGWGIDVIDRQYTEVTPLTWLGILSIVPVGYILYKAQMAANMACDDPDGTYNSHFTWANYAWLALGLVVWGLILLDLVVEV